MNDDGWELRKQKSSWIELRMMTRWYLCLLESKWRLASRLCRGHTVCATGLGGPMDELQPWAQMHKPQVSTVTAGRWRGLSTTPKYPTLCRGWGLLLFQVTVKPKLHGCRLRHDVWNIADTCVITHWIHCLATAATLLPHTCWQCREPKMSSCYIWRPPAGRWSTETLCVLVPLSHGMWENLSTTEE